MTRDPQKRLYPVDVQLQFEQEEFEVAHGAMLLKPPKDAKLKATVVLKYYDPGDPEVIHVSTFEIEGAKGRRSEGVAPAGPVTQALGRAIQEAHDAYDEAAAEAIAEGEDPEEEDDGGPEG